MPIDPNIILQGMPQSFDTNALLQQQMQGLQNINVLERQRKADEEAAQEALQAETLRALSPAVAAAFEDPSDAGLDAAFSLVPEEFGAAADEQLAQLRAIPDVNRRKAVIRSALLQDDYGRALLAQLEPTANMRLQAETAARRAELDQRRFELDMAKLEAEAAGGGVSPDVAARLEFDREKFAAEQAEKAKIASGEAAPVQLQKGERWNPDKQRVEAVPGSVTFNKQKSEHAKDFQGAINVDRQLQDVEDAVTDLMNTSSWQKMTNTGAMMARLPNVPGLSSLTGGYDFQTKLKNLDGVLKTLGRADATSSGKLGNMAIQEWRYVADAIANLDLTNMSADDLNEQLDIIMSKVREIRSNIRVGYDQEWGDTQFAADLPKSEKRTKAKGGRPGGVGPDWTLETDAQGNKAWVSPDRQNFIEVD